MFIPCLNFYYFLFFFSSYFTLSSSYRHPNSSILVGINALLTKPAHSLAPMIIVNLLNRAGYDLYVKGLLNNDAKAVTHLHSVMFDISCVVPFFVGVGQILAWSFYSIRSHERIAQRTPRG